MKSRITALLLTFLFLVGNVQASVQANTFSKSSELKIATSSFPKWISDEKSVGEDEFTFYPTVLHSNFSAPFFIKANYCPAIIATFAHKPSQAFILYRVLRN